MAGCPACGQEVLPDQTECPSCHLAASLFDAVREAAGEEADSDPEYVRTIADLLRSVELEGPAEPAALPLPRPTLALQPQGSHALDRKRPAVEPTPAPPLHDLPPLPAPVRAEPLRRRVEEYLLLARRLELDVQPLSDRASSAELTDDEKAMDALVRELFVHVASALAVAFESELARRNEIAELGPTPDADVELEALRGALDAGDLTAAERRLGRVREELGRLEEARATGRILLASCDLLSETITELGGDPAPALGPGREGRKRIAAGDTEVGDRLLAQGSRALWSILEPRFFSELKRLRDRLLELRTEGTDLAPALSDLRAVSVELRRRNFVGTIVAYRGLRDFVRPPGSGDGAGGPAAPLSAPPSPPTER